QVEVHVLSVDGQPPVVGIDPAPGLAVLPRERLAGESGRTVEAEVERRDHAPARPRFRHLAADVKPGRAPGWTPRIANLDRREGAADRVGVADRLAPHGESRQLESEAQCRRLRTTTGMRRSVRV